LAAASLLLLLLLLPLLVMLLLNYTDQHLLFSNVPQPSLVTDKGRRRLPRLKVHRQSPEFAQVGDRCTLSEPEVYFDLTYNYD